MPTQKAAGVTAPKRTPKGASTAAAAKRAANLIRRRRKKEPPATPEAPAKRGRPGRPVTPPKVSDTAGTEAESGLVLPNTHCQVPEAVADVKRALEGLNTDPTAPVTKRPKLNLGQATDDSEALKDLSVGDEPDADAEEPAVAAASEHEPGQTADTRQSTGPTGSTSKLELADIDPGINAVYLMKVKDNITKILDHAVFGDLANPATQPSVTPSLPQWQRTTHQQHMAASGSFTCSQNLFSLDLLTMPSKKVPVNTFKIKSLRETLLSRPTTEWPGNIPIDAVLSTHEQMDPMLRFGRVKISSPPEVPHAVLEQVVEDIDNGMADEDLQVWRALLLSSPVKYGVIDNENDRYKSSINIRESISTLGDVVKRTSLDRGHEVMEAKERAESDTKTQMTPKDCVTWWTTNITLDPTAEPVKVGFVDATVTVFKRLMWALPDTASLVTYYDHSGSGLFDSMYKLEKIVQKGGEGKGIHWCVVGVIHLVKKKIYNPAELSVRVLSGKGMPGGKGVLDLLTTQQEAAFELVAYAQRTKYEPCLTKRMTRWSQGADVYSQDMEKDPTLFAVLKPSSRALLKLFEEIVFSDEYFSALKTIKLQNKSIAWALSNTFKDKLEAIEHTLMHETMGRPTSGPTSSGEDGEKEDDDGKVSMHALKGVSDGTEGDDPAPSTLPQAIQDKDTTVLLKFKSYATNMYGRHCNLFVDPGDADALVALFKTVSFASVEYVANQKHLGVLYDCKLAGQASARPHLRIVPFRDAQSQRTIRAALALGDGKSIPTGHIYFLMDGHVHGNEARMLKCFQTASGKAIPKHKQTIYSTTTQKSESGRKDKVRGTASVSQVEFIHMVTKDVLAVPDIKRLHQEDSTQGDLIGPYDVPSKTDPTVWKVKHKAKTTLYGAGIGQCGGQAMSGVQVDANDKGPAGTDTVPFTYFGRNPKQYAELGHSYCVDSWLDLTGNDGTLAAVCVKQGKAYCGVCFTQEHKDGLQEHIINQIFRSFQTNGDPLYQPELATLLGQSKAPPAKPTPKADPPGPVPKKDGKPPPQATPKKPPGAVPNGKAGSLLAGLGSMTKEELLAKLSEIGDDDEGEEE